MHWVNEGTLDKRGYIGETKLHWVHQDTLRARRTYARGASVGMQPMFNTFAALGGFCGPYLVRPLPFTSNLTLWESKRFHICKAPDLSMPRHVYLRKPWKNPDPKPWPGHGSRWELVAVSRDLGVLWWVT